jgi:glycosyltransferase involved in cell wall biosynthesis
MRKDFKLLLCNGTLVGEGFGHLDHVQDLTPAAHDYVLERGAEPARHTVLPLGFNISPEFVFVSGDEREALRRRYGLPVDRRIIVSVAALNRYHKRLDYVIEEVASLGEERPFLLLLGQPEAETPGIRALSDETLTPNDYSMRTVDSVQVADLSRASDAFVLASVWEGLPRALIEASALGLPCLVHSYPITHFALGPHIYGTDMHKRGGLAALIQGITDADVTRERAAARHTYAYENFSWDRLTPRYIELLRAVAGAYPGSAVAVDHLAGTAYHTCGGADRH